MSFNAPLIHRQVPSKCPESRCFCGRSPHPVEYLATFFAQRVGEKTACRMVPAPAKEESRITACSDPFGPGRPPDGAVASEVREQLFRGGHGGRRRGRQPHEGPAGQPGRQRGLSDETHNLGMGGGSDSSHCCCGRSSNRPGQQLVPSAAEAGVAAAGDCLPCCVDGLVHGPRREFRRRPGQRD
jgi:hypothetical protein